MERIVALWRHINFPESLFTIPFPLLTERPTTQSNGGERTFATIDIRNDEVSGMTRVESHIKHVRMYWPEIDAQTLAPVGDGWTCDTYEADGRWIVQFPRTEHAEELLRKQKRILPRLAPRLPAPIPLPVPSVEPDTPAMLYRKVDGEPFPNRPAGTWPEQLGALLRDLQGVQPRELGIADCTIDNLRQEKRAVLDKVTERVLPLLELDERAEFERLFREYLDDEQVWQFRPVPVHGDLGPAHVLVNESGDLAGVIDWEELAVGDPAADFAWMLGEYPAVGRRMLVAFGGATDDGFTGRARFLHLIMPFYEVMYGQKSEQPKFIASGVEGVRSRLKRKPGCE